MEIAAPRPGPPDVGHPDPAAALAAAGGLPAGDGPLLVLVNDPDRATDSAAALVAVRAAARGRPLRILVATGSHRVPGNSRRRAHEGPLREAAGGGDVVVEWHDADADPHVALADTELDARLVASAEAVAVGSVEPHWFAGLTGAHKTLTVGVMSRAAITANHRHALLPQARALRLDGNPVHEGFARAVRALGEGRRLLAVQSLAGRWLAGDPLATLEALRPAARSRWEHRLPRPLDFVVAVVEPPLSRTLYQGEKGVKLTEGSVRDGGAIVLDAECDDGVGPARFVDLLRAAPDAETAAARVARDGYRLGDHKAVRLRELLGRGVRLGVVSRTLPADAAQAAGIERHASRQAAADWLREVVGAGARGALVEDAGHMVLEVVA